MLNKLPRFQPEGQAGLGVQRVPAPVEGHGAAAGWWDDADPFLSPFVPRAWGKPPFHPQASSSDGEDAEGSPVPTDPGVPVVTGSVCWAALPQLCLVIPEP